MNFIDLFAGAGGLSEGFIRADFTPIAHVESDAAACYTLRTRAVYQYLKDHKKLSEYKKYLKGEINRTQLYALVPEVVRDTVINKEISDENNKEIFKQIDKLRNGQDIDLVIGGPPCQAYSIMGRAVDKDNKEFDDRNFLYIQYARFLKRFSPKVFVFENVKGLLSAGSSSYLKNMTKYFRRIGYETDIRLLNAVNFGVLQNRERVIIIGWKKGIDFQYPEFENEPHNYFVSDIFSDLPFVRAGKGKDKNGIYRTTPATGYVDEYEIRNGIDILTQHIARPHIKRDLKIYRDVVSLWNKKKRRIKYNELNSELITHKNLSGFLDRFKVVAANQKFCQTVVAHIAKDGHHYIHPSLRANRSLTVREAARLQSFPDDYYFEGVKENKNRTAAFKQIGNAVPPLMAQKIADEIFNLLSN